MRRYSLTLFAASILLVGCPAANLGNKYPTYSGNPMPTFSPSPTPTPPANGLKGTVYDETTGQPVKTAWVVTGDRYTYTQLDGSFTSSITGASGSVTIIKTGYENLTVHGYQGGALPLTPIAGEPLVATMSTTIQLTAPSGAATDSIVAIAVKSGNHTYFSSETKRSVALSQSGTGSLTIDLPTGELMAIAYSSSGHLVGTAQGPVGSELGLSLHAVSSFDSYQTTMGSPTDGSVVNSVSYSVQWPGSNPARPNFLSLASVVGIATDTPVWLPPLDSLGLSSASFAVLGISLTNDSNHDLLGYVSKQPLVPGSSSLSLLPSSTADLYYHGDRSRKIPFSVWLHRPVSGANAHVLELTDTIYGTPRWKVISLGTSTESMYIPFLPDLLGSHDLPHPASYRVRLDGSVNPLDNWGDSALTFGLESVGTYSP